MEKEIQCVERNCSNMFMITEGEERFYHDKGLYLPKRCPDCREKRRKERDEKNEQTD